MVKILFFFIKAELHNPPFCCLKYPDAWLKCVSQLPRLQDCWWLRLFEGSSSRYLHSSDGLVCYASFHYVCCDIHWYPTVPTTFVLWDSSHFTVVRAFMMAAYLWRQTTSIIQCRLRIYCCYCEWRRCIARDGWVGTFVKVVCAEGGLFDPCDFHFQLLSLSLHSLSLLSTRYVSVVRCT